MSRATTSEPATGGRSISSFKAKITKTANSVKQSINQAKTMLEEEESPLRNKSIQNILSKLLSQKDFVLNYKTNVQKALNESDLSPDDNNSSIKQSLLKHCESNGYEAIKSEITISIEKLQKALNDANIPLDAEEDEMLSEDDMNGYQDTIESHQEDERDDGTKNPNSQQLLFNDSNDQIQSPNANREITNRNRITSPINSTSSSSVEEELSKQRKQLEELQAMMALIAEHLPTMNPQNKKQTTKDPPVSPKNDLFLQDIQRMSVKELIDTIDSFSGEDPEKYPEFITQFKHQVHYNNRLTPQIKYSILKKLLKGDARELVTTSDFSEASYELTLDLLEKHYMSDRTPVLMDQFRNKQFNQTDYDEMEKDLTKLIKLGNQLSSRKIDVNHPMIIDEMVKKLPSNMMTHVIKKNRNHELSFREVTELIRKRINDDKYIENAKVSQRRSTPLNEVCAAINFKKSNNSNTEKSNQKFTKSNKSKGGRSEIKCNICGEAHTANKCPKSDEEIEKVIGEKQLCRNCTCPGHTAKECKSKFTCFHCKQKHLSRICNYKKLTQQIASMSKKDLEELKKQFFRDSN